MKPLTKKAVCQDWLRLSETLQKRLCKDVKLFYDTRVDSDFAAETSNDAKQMASVFLEEGSETLSIEPNSRFWEELPGRGALRYPEDKDNILRGLEALFRIVGEDREKKSEKRDSDYVASNVGEGYRPSKRSRVEGSPELGNYNWNAVNNTPTKSVFDQMMTPETSKRTDKTNGLGIVLSATSSEVDSGLSSPRDDRSPTVQATDEANRRHFQLAQEIEANVPRTRDFAAESSAPSPQRNQPNGLGTDDEMFPPNDIWDKISPTRVNKNTKKTDLAWTNYVPTTTNETRGDEFSERESMTGQQNFQRPLRVSPSVPFWILKATQPRINRELWVGADLAKETLSSIFNAVTMYTEITDWNSLEIKLETANEDWCVRLKRDEDGPFESMKPIFLQKAGESFQESGHRSIMYLSPVEKRENGKGREKQK